MLLERKSRIQLFLNFLIYFYKYFSAISKHSSLLFSDKDCEEEEEDGRGGSEDER